MYGSTENILLYWQAYRADRCLHSISAHSRMLVWDEKADQIRNLLEMSYDFDMRGIEELTLDDALLLTAERACEDPRDVVYSALAFLPTNLSKIIRPEYGRSTFELAKICIPLLGNMPVYTSRLLDGLKVNHNLPEISMRLSQRFKKGPALEGSARGPCRQWISPPWLWPDAWSIGLKNDQLLLGPKSDTGTGRMIIDEESGKPCGLTCLWTEPGDWILCSSWAPKPNGEDSAVVQCLVVRFVAKNEDDGLPRSTSHPAGSLRAGILAIIGEAFLVRGKAQPLKDLYTRSWVGIRVDIIYDVEDYILYQCSKPSITAADLEDPLPQHVIERLQTAICRSPMSSWACYPHNLLAQPQELGNCEPKPVQWTWCTDEMRPYLHTWQFWFPEHEE